ncbi:hypothetical protein Pmar_PMAR025513 [Perkinsus marinus ATCC 50983]|uniref:Uncharacterized protein n=1 Tax=Perkinsus marinus (strain ATCC 50983 / TXsc) TaxID=423536 RepID=C5LZ96_PERM5|nr:hypothetical protein Pmar_PMAR025513 [Perkinsus marinus ATCC 50983]EEQ97890.1 hypothetical protein Pmar_PMAR025513 [Perkinsus marinus ATCC 50983]|eukprot:XP_002765173.1 hypothetical protein Pmar_PMAR025513 [Perkinsus marinus ATCC 50983]
MSVQQLPWSDLVEGVLALYFTPSRLRSKAYVHYLVDQAVEMLARSDIDEPVRSVADLLSEDESLGNCFLRRVNPMKVLSWRDLPGLLV